MSNKQVQICIVSAEPMANILPIRALQPDVVVLVVSARMKDAGQRLARFLARHGIRSVEAFDAPDHGLAAIREFALDRIREMTGAGVSADSLTLNATGGNKLMAMGFIEAARETGVGRIIYADTGHDRIEFLHPEHEPPMPMGQLASLEDLFESRGLRILRMDSADPDWQERARARSELTRWLFSLSLQRPSPLGALRVNLNPRVNAIPRVRSFLVKRLSDEGLLKKKGSSANHQLSVISDDAAFYLQGGWLEELIWLEARGINDVLVGCGLRLQLEEDVGSDEELHELDLVIVHRNRLLLGECKVCRTRVADADSDLDRLRALAASISGPFGKLVYIVPEMNRIEPTIRKRCADQPIIELATRPELSNLRGWLEDRLKA